MRAVRPRQSRAGARTGGRVDALGERARAERKGGKGGRGGRGGERGWLHRSVASERDDVADRRCRGDLSDDWLGQSEQRQCPCPLGCRSSSLPLPPSLLPSPWPQAYTARRRRTHTLCMHGQRPGKCVEAHTTLRCVRWRARACHACLSASVACLCTRTERRYARVSTCVRARPWVRCAHLQRVQHRMRHANVLERR